MDLEGEKLEGAYCVPLHAVFNGPCSEDNVGQRDDAFYNIVAVGEKINSEYLIWIHFNCFWLTIIFIDC